MIDPNCPNAKPALTPYRCPICGKSGCEGTHVRPAPPQDAEPDDAAIARAFEAQQTRGPEHVMVLKSDYRALRDRLAAAEKRVEVLEAAQLTARLACECGAFGRREKEKE